MQAEGLVTTHTTGVGVKDFVFLFLTLGYLKITKWHCFGNFPPSNKPSVKISFANYQSIFFNLFHIDQMPDPSFTGNSNCASERYFGFNLPDFLVEASVTLPDFFFRFGVGNAVITETGWVVFEDFLVWCFVDFI